MEREVLNEDVATMPRESFGELLAQLASQSAALVRDEIDLAKQEAREKVQSFRSGIIAVTAGAVLLLLALMSLCAAVIIGLAHYMSPGISALIIGVVLVIIGGAAAFIGFRQFKKTPIKPEKTIGTLKEDKEWLKEMT